MKESRDIKHIVCVERIKQLEEENKKLKEKNEKLEEDNINLISFNEQYSPDVIVKYVDRYETLYNEVDIECAKLSDENKRLNIKVASLEGEIKGLNYTIDKLREENQYRGDIANVLPEGKGHIAEETIQDLQCRIRDLVGEKENLSELNRKQSKAFKSAMKDYRDLLRNYMKIGEENKKLREELEKLRADNIYEEGLYE